MTGRTHPDVRVVGAGISGLAVAAALRRHGRNCTVLEQARDLTVLGAGLQLSPNAVRLLRRLGIESDLLQDAVAVRSLDFLRWQDGSLLARLPLGLQAVEAFGSPYLTVHRADLHRALRRLLPEDCVVLGASCAGVEDTGSEVRLSFADGQEELADVVIGADGIHSRVRGALANDPAAFTGQVIHRGLVDSGRVPVLAQEPRVRIWLGPHRHLVCYPVSGGKQLYFGATAPAAAWGSDRWSHPSVADEVMQGYRGWCDEVQELLAHAHELTCWALHDRAPAQTWVGPRLAVIGDAAHAMLPFLAQAANQAVEDAWVLASCLARADPQEALRRYEALRRPRVERVHLQSTANAGVFHLPDGPAQQSRDQSLPQQWSLAELDWLFGYDAAQLEEGLLR